jgi:MFS family permease
LKSQRDFRNYLAGAALAFGVVLLTSQILQLIYGGVSAEEAEALYSLILNIYLAAHIAGGFLGGYLVARVRRTDYIQTGTMTAIIAYIFEFVYNIVVESVPTDVYAVVSLLIGGIIGAMFFKSKTEREKIASVKKSDEPKPSPEPLKQE